MANSSAEVDDDVFVRRCLWNRVPESRPHIVSLEEEEADVFGEGGEGSPGMYSLVSVCFVHPVLVPALRATPVDAVLAVRCARLIEDLLGSGRPLVAELVSVRITDQLLGYRELWEAIQGFAGPLLLREVAERMKFYYGFD